MIPEISVIIPTYNRAELVGNAIRSVLNQTFVNFEVIVVDDGSDDNTREVVSKFGDKVIYVYQENKERSAARNNGIRHSRGQYVAFLDSDDQYMPDKLQVQYELMEKNPGYGMSYSYSVWVNETGEYLHTWRGVLDGWIYPEIMLVKNTKITTPSVMIRKSVFDTVGYFNENLSTCEDYELWCRISKHFQVLLIKKSLVKIFSDTQKLKDIFIQYFEGNLTYYNSVLGSDTNISKYSKKKIYLDLFIKYYMNSKSLYHKESVISRASEISAVFPFTLFIVKLVKIIGNGARKYSGLLSVVKFFKNNVLISLPSVIFSEEMEYSIIPKISESIKYVIGEKYKKSIADGNYYLVKGIDRKSRISIRNYLIECNYMSSSKIASILKIE